MKLPVKTNQEMYSYIADLLKRSYSVANVLEADGLVLFHEMFKYETASRDKNFNVSAFDTQVGYEWLTEGLKKNGVQHSVN